MEHALIICDAPKAAAYFEDFLKKADFMPSICQNGPQALRKMLDRPAELILINAPLKAQSAEDLAADIAAKNISQVILVIKNEYLYDVQEKARRFGILTIGKPIRIEELSLSLSFARIAQQRISMMLGENRKLQKKIADLRITNQAKLLLIQYEHCTEDEAHHRIEQIAMDQRKSRLAVAKEIIGRYE